MAVVKEKLKAIAHAVSAIEKQFGKGSIMCLGDDSVDRQIEVVPTGSLGLGAKATLIVDVVPDRITASG